MSNPLIIRRMTGADVPAGMRFKHQAGWNQTAADWRRFLSLHPQGCFVGCIDDRVVATVTTAVFDRVGWIAMVLVDLEHRHRGFGKNMLKHAVDHLDPLVETIKLDATELGRPLYEQLGFQAEYELTRYQCRRSIESPAATNLTPIEISDELIEFDTAIYGTHRSALLTELARERQPGRIVRRNGRITGYAIIRPGDNALHFGPALAEDVDAFQSIADWFNQIAIGDCYFDMPDGSAYAASIQHAFQPTVQRKYLRMYRGPDPFRGVPTKVIATSGAEKG